MEAAREDRSLIFAEQQLINKTVLDGLIERDRTVGVGVAKGGGLDGNVGSRAETGRGDARAPQLNRPGAAAAGFGKQHVSGRGTDLYASHV